MQVIYGIFAPLLPGIFYGFSADGDEVTDGLLMDQQMNPMMYGGIGIYLHIGFSGYFIQQYLWVFSQ